MDTPDVKPDPSLLKRGTTSSTESSQPASKMIKTENNTGNNPSSSSAPEQNENVGGVSESGSSFAHQIESKELVHCIFPQCNVMCLSKEAMDRHFNMRHATVNINTTKSEKIDVNDYLVFPSKSSRLSTSQGNKSQKDTPCNVSCMMPDCNHLCRNFDELYRHRLRVHELSPPPDTIYTVSCLDPDCTRVFVDREDMQKHFGESHYEPQNNYVNFNTNQFRRPDVKLTVSEFKCSGVNSTDLEFKCPLPFCKSLSFSALQALENHCLTCHHDYNFPWCSPGRNIECPMPKCKGKFNRQTGLESHMKAKHKGQNPPSTTTATPNENQQVFKCMFGNCLFSTSDLAVFNHHQYLHIGDIPRFQCNFPNCRAAFIDEEVIIEHQQVIHGIQPF